MTAISGINANDYNTWKLNNANYATYTYAPTEMEVAATQGDAYVSASGETCTDGKDDGKIGFFSAIGNAIKGVGKTIVNGVKGMFTNKEGKFSLGKTLLSAGLIAASIAFPAVGVVLAGVGCVMGAVQVGKGVYNAATAETDAQAKEAWQEIGGGTFQVAASVVAAKAGVKAVKATSTAGTNGASALGSLDDAAAAGQKISIGQKASALGKDMISSTKNNAATLKTSATNLYNSKFHKNTGDVPGDEVAGYLDAPEGSTAAKTSWTDKARNTWAEVKGKVTKENAQKLWTDLQAKIKNFKLKDVGGKIKGLGEKLNSKQQQIYTELTSTESTYAQVVNKYGYENVQQVLQYVGGEIYAAEDLI